jgi:hypothetical protein
MIISRTVRTLLPLLILGTGLLSMYGCVSAGSAQQGAVRERIGVASPQDVVNKTRQVLLAEYGYRFDREVTTSEDMRFITQWQQHTPTEEERAAGTAACRTRVRVNARPKDRSSGQVRTYTVIFTADYEVQREGDNITWYDAPIPESREAYFERLTDDLEDEMASGVRSY